MGDEWGDGGVSEWLAGLWREATGFRAAEDCQKHLTAYEQQLIVAGLRCPGGAETSTDVQCAIIAASLRFELRGDAWLGRQFFESQVCKGAGVGAPHLAQRTGPNFEVRVHG